MANAETSKDAKAQLDADAKWAASLLDKLCQSGSIYAMPPDCVKNCEGLAFLRVTKAGLGVTLARGTGFVIRKLSRKDEHGHMRWSDPVYFTIKQIGIGAAAGYETVESCVVLNTVHAVDNFVDRGSLGVDALAGTTEGIRGIPAGALGNNATSDVQVEFNLEFADATKCYSLASGALASVAFTGTDVSHDQDRNSALYGGVPVAHVLSGMMAPRFQEMTPLYDKITQLGKMPLVPGL
ncbi:hypothetical protein HYH03_001820 [Edaphochlamys debaryana]|uniref:Ysc84 actin-binding domain-containing protein n=1 Tax=Edaphochlamys debaryana TaxID=47281 RepID=A0A835YEL0_9CHLO|nr:hypothetical protein HYH03_001820 [Edaphochlamys debaryana]|eukprot:KAG2500242.1 hypothetical protein HYH03_001820 [Edaphochlamys debaryana]